jgi:hypothetical protein
MQIKASISFLLCFLIVAPVFAQRLDSLKEDFNHELFISTKGSIPQKGTFTIIGYAFAFWQFAYSAGDNTQLGVSFVPPVHFALFQGSFTVNFKQVLIKQEAVYSNALVFNYNAYAGVLHTAIAHTFFFPEVSADLTGSMGYATDTDYAGTRGNGGLYADLGITKKLNDEYTILFEYIHVENPFQPRITRERYFSTLSGIRYTGKKWNIDLAAAYLKWGKEPDDVILTAYAKFVYRIQ